MFFDRFPKAEEARLSFAVCEEIFWSFEISEGDGSERFGVELVLQFSHAGSHGEDLGEIMFMNPRVERLAGIAFY